MLSVILLSYVIIRVQLSVVYSSWSSDIAPSGELSLYCTTRSGITATSLTCIIISIIILFVYYFLNTVVCLSFAAVGRLTSRLDGSACIPPADLVLPRAPVPDISVTLLCDQQNLLFALHSDFLSLVDHARVHGERVARHLDLDCSFVELIPRLYVNVPTEVSNQ